MSTNRHNCTVIGLLGGIGAGKSAIAGIFRDLGAVVVDADSIARQIVTRPEIQSRIVSEFGPGVLEGAHVSRRALAQAAFTDEKRVRALNSIVHPAVIEEAGRVIDEARRQHSCRGIVLDAPLIIEAGLEGMCDHLVFVEAGETLRRKRLGESRGWDQGELDRREKFQESLILKRQRADYIIDNGGSLVKTIEQVTAIWTAIVKD